MEPPHSFANKTYHAVASQSSGYPPPGGYPQAPPPQPHPQAYPPQSYPAPAPGPVGYYPQSQPQQSQQQQSVAVVGAVNRGPVVVRAVLTESYGGHQLFACVVLWFCNFVFGLIAWILALVADSTTVDNPAKARRLGKASIGMSVSGIVVAIIIVAVCLSVMRAPSETCNYRTNGRCYSSRRYLFFPCDMNSWSACCHSNEVYSNYYCYTDR